jgi:hypothetical protein
VNNWVLLPEARRQYGPGVTAGDVLGLLPDILNSGDYRPAARRVLFDTYLPTDDTPVD